MRRLLLLLALLPLVVVSPLRGQTGRSDQRLEAFIADVAALWREEEASSLAELVPSSGQMVLEIGREAAGPVQERHAAAALRTLFADRESVSIRPTRITVAGGEPLQGFGELSWVSRSRGVTVPQMHTIYVGVVWEGRGWRIREIRVFP
ncbi:MAG TPA: hypothetical protein VHG28_01865 [Longimicrobiaceae bacterium]|nr:hypothetical protein [Longimicrobiaceae bacterium]